MFFIFFWQRAPIIFTFRVLETVCYSEVFCHDVFLALSSVPIYVCTIYFRCICGATIFANT